MVSTFSLLAMLYVVFGIIPTDSLRYKENGDFNLLTGPFASHVYIEELQSSPSLSTPVISISM